LPAKHAKKRENNRGLFIIFHLITSAKLFSPGLPIFHQGRHNLVDYNSLNSENDQIEFTVFLSRKTFFIYLLFLVLFAYFAGKNKIRDNKKTPTSGVFSEQRI